MKLPQGRNTCYYKHTLTYPLTLSHAHNAAPLLGQVNLCDAWGKAALRHPSEQMGYPRGYQPPPAEQRRSPTAGMQKEPQDTC